MSPDYQIHELAEKAGVSIRTIRFYIDEGLLPAPQVRGRYSVYSDEYLERIELIRLLKNKYLPLREIRNLLHTSSEEEIKVLLEQERNQEVNQIRPNKIAEPSPKDSKNSNALDYVNRVLKRQPPTSPNRLNQTIFYKMDISPTMLPKDELLPEEEETWSLIRLAPGIELHIQKPVEDSTQKKLDQLIHYARKLFNL